MPLTPNQVTLIAWAIGLLAALCFAHGSWVSGVLGALLLQWSSVIDCCDGEVARLKFLESTSGYYLDITCDNIVHVAVFGHRMVRLSGVGADLCSAVGRLGGLWDPDGICRGVGHTPWPCAEASAALDRLIDALANRDFSLILVICALTGTLPWFLWALAIGVNLFWLIVLGLAWQAQRTGHG